MMNIQLALDRMTIPGAVRMARNVHDYVDWIEVGTSLIKEFGMESIRAIKREFPNKVIVADMKTFDNAKYEFELCFKAGADAATVMGAASPITVNTCIETAEALGTTVMIDLLHTSLEQQAAILQYNQAVPCLHVSKDEQEHTGSMLQGRNPAGANALPEGQRFAMAGGITQKSLPGLLKFKPFILIIGSAITNAADPRQAAFEIRQVMNEFKER